MWEIIKKHPGKIFAGTTGTIIFTVGGFFFSDARYVHSDEYKKQNIELREEIRKLQIQVKELSKN